MSFKRAMAWKLIQISYWMTERLSGFNLEVLQWEMEQLSGVIDVHTIHVWRTHYRSNVLSAHIVIEDLKYAKEIKASLKAMLANRYNIVETTHG